MICIVDISKVDLDKSKKACLAFPFLSELTAEGKSERVRRERVGSYLSLKLSYEKLYGTSMPSLYRDAFGKVHFKTNKDDTSLTPNFNLSHSEGICVILFADGDILAGVDVEKCDNSRACEKIERRFLKNVNNYLQKDAKKDIKVFYAALSEDGEQFDFFLQIETNDNIIECNTIEISDGLSEKYGKCSLPCSLSVTVDSAYDFFQRWTVTEALLKADGRGFSAISSLDDIAHCSSISSYVFRYFENYYVISAALLKKM